MTIEKRAPLSEEIKELEDQLKKEKAKLRRRRKLKKKQKQMDDLETPGINIEEVEPHKRTFADMFNTKEFQLSLHLKELRKEQMKKYGIERWAKHHELGKIDPELLNKMINHPELLEKRDTLKRDDQAILDALMGKMHQEDELIKMDESRAHSTRRPTRRNSKKVTSSGMNSTRRDDSKNSLPKHKGGLRSTFQRLKTNMEKQKPIGTSRSSNRKKSIHTDTTSEDDSASDASHKNTGRGSIELNCVAGGQFLMVG